MTKQLLMVLWGFCLISLAGCYRDAGEGVNTPLPIITTWRTLAEGMDERVLQMGENSVMQLYVLRIDPSRYRFETHYQPTIARSIEEWQAELPTAKAIINTNFFEEGYTITGLLIQNGQSFGWNYTDRGGTFFVRDGLPYITHNIFQPFNPNGVEHAIQAFPMLVYNGEAAYTQRDMRATRRTAIGQDTQGRILLMVTPVIGPSLYDFSQFLAGSDLNLVNAFNLDGGRSTMIAVSETNYLVRSFERVPAVLAVYAK